MINKTFQLDDLRINLFDYSHEEWHKVRAQCLLEKNWLRDNYLPSNCKVEDHEMFYIAYTLDGEPINFGGIKRYNSKVTRSLNRMYMFPKFRSPKKFGYHQNLLANLIIPLCETHMEKKFPLTFVSMQMRDKGYAGEQKWWTFWKNSWLENSKGWKTYDKLVQVVDGDRPECYQNIVYKESSSFKFEDWNPKTLSYEEYSAKFG